MKLALDSVVCFMMLLQKALMEDLDMTTLVESMEFELREDDLLYVSNQESFNLDTSSLLSDLDDDDDDSESLSFDFLETK